MKNNPCQGFFGTHSLFTHFKRQAEETGISYQNLINIYLTDCAVHEKKLEYTIK